MWKNRLCIYFNDDDCINSYDDLLNNIICQVYNIKKNEDKEFYQDNTFPQIQNEDFFFFFIFINKIR